MFTMSDHEMLQYQTRQPPPPSPPLVMMERSWKPNVEIAPNCPRCASSNTKFCYYNNYSFSQPRYFCKGCRRYWTKGGSLRNVPVGGGCRKARRSSKSSLKSPSSSSQTDRLITDHNPVDPPVGSDIDIAAVFANFLNHNNNSSTTDEDHHVMMMDGQQQQQQQPSDHSTQEFDGQDYQDMDVFGVQDVVVGLGGSDNDHQVVEDALWSDVTGLWQPLDQFQEFDQMVVASSTNLINHDGCCWTSSSSSSSSSFDLPSYELFSRP